jgi:hypothetical protein
LLVVAPLKSRLRQIKGDEKVTDLSCSASRQRSGGPGVLRIRQAGDDQFLNLALVCDFSKMTKSSGKGTAEQTSSGLK